MTGELTRAYLKHKIEALVFAVEVDERRTVLGALDVSDEETKGGLCHHMLSSLPLKADIDIVSDLNRNIKDFALYEPECGNTHHLMHDLISLEREYRDASRAFESADRTRKALQKNMEECGTKVHDLLERIYDRKPPPTVRERVERGLASSW